MAKNNTFVIVLSYKKISNVVYVSVEFYIISHTTTHKFSTLQFTHCHVYSKQPKNLHNSHDILRFYLTWTCKERNISFVWILLLSFPTATQSKRRALPWAIHGRSNCACGQKQAQTVQPTNASTESGSLDPRVLIAMEKYFSYLRHK